MLISITCASEAFLKILLIVWCFCAKFSDGIKINYHMVQTDWEVRGFSTFLLAIKISALGRSTMNTQKDLLCNILLALSNSDCRYLFDM